MLPGLIQCYVTWMSVWTLSECCLWLRPNTVNFLLTVLSIYNTAFTKVGKVYLSQTHSMSTPSRRHTGRTLPLHLPHPTTHHITADSRVQLNLRILDSSFFSFFATSMLPLIFLRNSENAQECKKNHGYAKINKIKTLVKNKVNQKTLNFTLVSKINLS